MDEILLKKVERIERKLDLLLREKKTEEQKVTWVKVSTVMDLTGWDKDKVRRMVRDGLVVRKKENGFWYMLESINQVFIIKNQ